MSWWDALKPSSIAHDIGNDILAPIQRDILAPIARGTEAASSFIYQESILPSLRFERALWDAGQGLLSGATNMLKLTGNAAQYLPLIFLAILGFLLFTSQGRSLGGTGLKAALHL